MTTDQRSHEMEVNGKLMEACLPQRDLRQGDPLSPYLFIICAEAFSKLLQQAELEGTIEGVKICPGAPSINHLFFADDSLIVMKATEASAVRLKELHDLYESQSGQKINRDKSSAFSVKTRVFRTNRRCCKLLEFQQNRKTRGILACLCILELQSQRSLSLLRR